MQPGVYRRTAASALAGLFFSLYGRNVHFLHLEEFFFPFIAYLKSFSCYILLTVVYSNMAIYPSFPQYHLYWDTSLVYLHSFPLIRCASKLSNYFYIYLAISPPSLSLSPLNTSETLVEITSCSSSPLPFIFWKSHHNHRISVSFPIFFSLLHVLPFAVGPSLNKKKIHIPNSPLGLSSISLFILAA